MRSSAPESYTSIPVNSRGLDFVSMRRYNPYTLCCCSGGPIPAKLHAKEPQHRGGTDLCIKHSRQIDYNFQMLLYNNNNAKLYQLWIIVHITQKYVLYIFYITITRSLLTLAIIHRYVGTSTKLYASIFPPIQYYLTGMQVRAQIYAIFQTSFVLGKIYS